VRLAVVDASVLVDLVGEGSEGDITLLGSYDALHAPSHVDVECVNALRGRMLGRLISNADFTVMARLIPQLPVTRHAISALVPRILSLALYASAYDASYIALSEALDADLLTTDAALASVPGIGCTVLVL
jgi:predicted nucleic acid-binding protein